MHAPLDDAGIVDVSAHLSFTPGERASRNRPDISTGAASLNSMQGGVGEPWIAKEDGRAIEP